MQKIIIVRATVRREGGEWHRHTHTYRTTRKPTQRQALAILAACGFEVKEGEVAISQKL